MLIHATIDSKHVDIEINADRNTFATDNIYHRANKLNRYARDQKATHVLIRGDTIFTAHASAISIAAQLEHHFLTESFSGEVIVPLDNKLYCAEIDDGLVTLENVDPLEEGLDKIKETPTTARRCPSGLLEADLLALGVNELEFTLGLGKAPEWRYKSLRREFFRNKLLTIPAIIIPAVTLLVFLLAAIAAYQYIGKEHLRQSTQSAIAKAEQITKNAIPARPEASQSLRNLAGLMDGLVAYQANGLDLLVLKNGDIQIDGHILTPSNHHRLVEIAEEQGDTLSVQAQQWQSILPPLPQTSLEDLPLAPLFQILHMLQRELALCGIELELISQDVTASQLKVQVSMQPADAIFLRHLADHLDVQAAQLIQATVHYDDLLPASADLIIQLSGTY